MRWKVRTRDVRRETREIVGLILVGAFALAVEAVAAFDATAIELVAPVGGEKVTLLPEGQRELMALPTYEARLSALRAESNRYAQVAWRESEPVKLRWTAGNGTAPYRILVGTTPDLKDAKGYYTDKTLEWKTRGDVTDCCWTIPCANLELGRTYYWQVIGNLKCRTWYHRSDCGCTNRPTVVRSAVASFVTDAQAPRWIAIEGRVKNIRDLGGRETRYGRRVRQGRVYRGQGLNDNSAVGDRRGRNRLTVEDVGYLTGELGIKTDLDLRSDCETADMTASPLGPSVKFVHRPSMSYRGIFGDEGKKVMAENFRLFCDARNYPVYFHCIAGADRTGALAYVLNGVLGVDRHELETDWEATFYPRLPELRANFSGPNYWCRLQHLADGFAKYGTPETSWNDRIELYLLDCGVTKEEIARFRELMLEP